MPDNPLGILGYLAGKMHANDQGGLLSSVTGNAPRPFARGEYMDNPDGSWSSEMTYTVNDPRYGVNPDFNGGRPTVLPGLWIKDGKPYHATEDEAMQMAIASGLHFPSYPNATQAEDVANAREAGWQNIPRQNASMGAPLFLPPLPRKR